MVSRRLMKVDKGWGGRGGFDAVQCLVQVANVCDRGAADHARRFSCGMFSEISDEGFQGCFLHGWSFGGEVERRPSFLVC